ncbi:MAG TPA: hypothetical protein VLZ12_06255 [Verrucomicrobiae bacterium]|nr:hypothetical protein [Verrucomicrobiae bacterium]
MKRAQVNHLTLGLQVAIGFIFAAVVTTVAIAGDVPTRKDTVLASVTATVQAVDLETREVTLKNQAGNTFKFIAGPEIQRLNQVKVGDTVSVGYQLSFAAELREPTAAEKAKPLTITEETVRATGTTAPAGVGTRQIRAVTTIEAIDRSGGTLTVKGPLGRTFTVRVADPTRLEKLQVGQTIVITCTEDVAISLERTGNKTGE